MTAAPGLDESALTGVWAGVVGQEPLVATLTPGC
jgi:hypothetical protein